MKEIPATVTTDQALTTPKPRKTQNLELAAMGKIASIMNRKRKCEVCGRKEGDEIDLGGDPDGVPLGPVDKCDSCGRWSCPDCQHESDCCWQEWEDMGGPPEDRPLPKGWKRDDLLPNVFHRIDQTFPTP